MHFGFVKKGGGHSVGNRRQVKVRGKDLLVKSIFAHINSHTGYLVSPLTLASN